MFNHALKIALACAFVATASSAAWAKKGGGGSSGDYRSAKSGQYVKKGYAERNKGTTVREQRKKN
jgi:hypothetical protein